MKKPPPLRQILHSKRANIYYLERCRILVRGGRVEYLTQDTKKGASYWNIPIANTTFILLGNGTSITQGAARMLAAANVPFGFCAGAGTPLYSAVDTVWVSPTSEYGPTKYMQSWMQMWLDPDRRLEAARKLQRARVKFTKAQWQGADLRDQGFNPTPIRNLVENFEDGLEDCSSGTALMGLEGTFTKELYQRAAEATQYGPFKRDSKGGDPANEFLSYGNYLAYGCGNVVCWVLGLTPSLSVLHGRTRRGGLVYDFADIIKDGVILPQAFLSAQAGHTKGQFKDACIHSLMNQGALDTMFNVAKGLAT